MAGMGLEVGSLEVFCKNFIALEATTADDTLKYLETSRQAHLTNDQRLFNYNRGYTKYSDAITAYSKQCLRKKAITDIVELTTYIC